MNVFDTTTTVPSIAPNTGGMGVKTTLETTLFQKAINATATDLYRQMCAVRNVQNKNFIFFTPNLIASLSMLYAGAPAELKTEMEKALHMGELKEQMWHSSFQNWSEGIEKRCRGLSQSVPSMLKADQERLKFQQTQIITTHSDAPLTHQARCNLMYYSPEMFTFSKPEEAQKLINDRVAQKTEGKIQNLVENVSSNLTLIMASAALFKGQWQYPFEKKDNSEEVFSNSDGSCVRVEMMNKGIDDLRMAYDHNEVMGNSIQILELPFHGDVSLLLFKLDTRWGGKVQDCAPALQKYMTRDTIQGLLDNYEKRFNKTSALTVGIPKVNLREKSDFLKELSHTELAQKLLSANFSGSLVQTNIATLTPALVSEVNFTMDEDGAAVAAASYSPTYYQSCDPEYKLNVPFGLAIVDRTTQTILGMGQVLHMEGEKVDKKW
jgi:serine protease inhibitor